MISPRILFLAFLLLISFTANSQTDSLAGDSLAAEEEEVVRKDTVKVGVYITSIYSLGFAENDFGIDFWVWFVHKNKDTDPKETMEIFNSESQIFEYGTNEEKGDYMWSVQKCRAMIKKNWEISRFPLDDQTLDVILEETDRDTSELVYIADIENSKIDPSVDLSGWKVEKFDVIPLVKSYNTTYGDPTLTGASSYARLQFTTKITRDSGRIFLKLFLGLYVAFLIALAVFFLDGSEIGARTSLAVGALFAAVGNKYIVDSSMPDHTSFTVVDKIHNLTFALIFMSIVFNVISNASFRKGKAQLGRRIDYGAFVFLMAAYIIGHLFIVSE
jgi:hypothetical protein